MREQLQQQADDYHAAQFVPGPPAPATPVDMPRDADGNIAYESGNFFQSKEYPDGLPKPPHAHEPTPWPSLIVDPSILSTPAPTWQHPATRFGLLNRVTAGPFYKLGYRGHCHACDGYFLTLEWAQSHDCPKEAAFRDMTDRVERDYSALRKAAKQLAAEKAQYAAQHKGILSALKRVIFRAGR